MRCLTAVVVSAALAASAAAAGYLGPADLRMDTSAVAPDPFALAPPASRPAPAVKASVVPDGMQQLSVRRGYLLTVEGEGSPAARPLSVAPRNPFLNAPPPAPPTVPKEAAADWRQAWEATWTGDAWQALLEAWTADPVAVRKAFRDASKLDWPLDEGGPGAEAARLAAARWVQGRWNDAVRDAIAAARASAGIRGPILARGPLDAGLTALRAGASNPAPIFSPRVTADPDVNLYGVGFLVRLSADLGERIPVPVLDLSALPEGDLGWLPVWVDEAVRNGVAGLTVLPPRGAAGAAKARAALAPMGRANIYLPPPGEAAILISTATATLEPGAWAATFHTYARMRRAGLWPALISDRQLEDGAALARFAVLAVPAAKWGSSAVLAAIEDFQARGGIVATEDPEAFTRRLDGRGMAGPAPGPMTKPIPSSPPDWAAIAAQAGLVKRPWLQHVGARNVRSITGSADPWRPTVRK